ncbi:YceI family protein [Nibrella saemangeumensis]|uniref:YceI family protein n=1 Tax=Nibrella saemangeumensis TaxID=1084526 RepID=A0ABP8NNU5_9BACT
MVYVKGSRLAALVIVLTFAGAWSPAANPLWGKRKLMADKSASVVTYAMKHPMHSWEGVSRDVNSAIVYNDETQAVENVAVSIKVASFDSGNANRDSNAMETLEALKYPNVTFVSQNIQAGANGGLTIKGNMTFHNVTKPITVQATRKDGNGRITVDGGFDLQLSDYNVKRPTLMTIPVDEEVRMKFTVVYKL